MAMAPPPQETEAEPHHHQRQLGNHPGGAGGGAAIATNRWGPYSGAGDFASNMAVILAALLAALALALALNAAVRYLLRRRARDQRAGTRPETTTAAASNAENLDPEKPAPPPALVYSAAGTKLAGAAAECAICLAEFADGDAVRVMPACGHGFHARCIERWLAGGRRSSCPTCRAPVAVGPPPPAEASAGAASTPSSS